MERERPWYRTVEPACRLSGAARASAATRSAGSSERDVDLGQRQRMREREPPRVQELALEAEVARDAVDGIAADRQADRLEMDADLVRPARLEPDVEERVVRASSPHLEPRDRFARRRGVERVARAIAAVAADRRLDPSGCRLRRAPDEGGIRPFELA